MGKIKHNKKSMMIQLSILPKILHILLVYSLFSDRVGLPPHNAPFPGVLMNSIGAVFLQPDALPDVNHMRGIYYSLISNNSS